MLRYSWTCGCCGRQHDELPIHWSVEAPAYYDAVPEAERAARTRLSDDFCTVDDQYFFIRGVIEIPILGQSEPLTWGAWASLSAASMDAVHRVWEQADRELTGPFFGWLSAVLPYEIATVGLKTMVHLRDPPFLPWLELEPTEHPLAVEQRNGISIERAVEIAEALLPRH